MMAPTAALGTAISTVSPPPAAAAAPPPQAARKSVAATLQKVWRAEGWRGVWRGYSAAYCGIASYVVGYFGVYEATRRTLLRTPLGEYTTLTHLLAGGLGGGLQRHRVVRSTRGGRTRCTHRFGGGADIGGARWRCRPA
ncbi:MAG: MC/SLC25 family protein, partial [Alcanivorax sp.]